MRRYFVIMTLLASIAQADIVNKTDAKAISLNNHQTVIVPLSSVDSNRLFVHHDKITDAHCLTGFCDIHFNASGGIYLTLGQAAKYSSGFSVFIATEQDKHFTVIGMPTNEVGQTIAFTVTGTTNKATPFEKNTPYQAMLVRVIRYMINPDQKDVTEGLTMTELPIDKTLKPNRQGLLVQPVKLFNGGVFNGIVYAIQNHTEKPITLTTQQFYQKTMVAGALSHTVLKPTEQGYFYGVMQSEDSDAE